MSVSGVRMKWQHTADRVIFLNLGFKYQIMFIPILFFLLTAIV